MPPTPENPTAGATVLLVDDQPGFLVLARMLLEDHPGLTVVGEAASGEAALDLAPSLRPDVALVDVEMPGMHGFETARRLLAARPDLRVVLVSAHTDPTYPEIARTVGARAFLNKRDLSAETLVQVLGT